MDNENDAPLEVLPPSAIMAMEKAQIDMQIATAHQYPRSLEQFKKRALSMATLDPETAESCIYVRNVGKELDKKTGRWVDKYAEGPSIRLAEIVAVSYGNLRAASKVVEQTERYVKCTGMAHDLESNTAMSADCIEATVTKEGKPYSERQRALIAKVCGAKAIRDAILKVVPRALCKPIMEASKKVAQGLDKPLEERRKKAQAWIASLKVSDDRVFTALGVTGWSDVTNEHLITLTGLKTAMADGDETIDSAFPAVTAAEKSGKPEPTDLQKSQAEPEKTLKVEKTEKKEKVAKVTEPPKTASEPPKEKEAAKTPPEAEKAPAEAAVSAAAPANPEGEAPKMDLSDEKEEAAAGLAPEQPKEAEKPPFVPNPAESPTLQGLRMLMHDKGITEEQMLVVLAKNQARKADKSKFKDMPDSEVMLCNMSDSRLSKIQGAFVSLVQQINDVPTP
jgi:hypothetical protein